MPSEQIFAALGRLGKCATFERYGGEGTSLSPLTYETCGRRSTAWFDKFGDVPRDARGQTWPFAGDRVKSRGGAPALKPEIMPHSISIQLVAPPHTLLQRRMRRASGETVLRVAQALNTLFLVFAHAASARRRVAVSFLCAATAWCWSLASLQAQSSSSSGAAVGLAPDSTANLPLRSSRTLRFATGEGTWLSLDVSPDGQTIVFDLLGDLYTLAITGGKAVRITSGMGFDAQPRFSPDGRTIVFVSDRSGSSNLWLVDADGRHARSLTREPDVTFVSPEWTADGSGVIASRGNARRINYGLVLYPLAGGGVPLTRAVPPAPRSFGYAMLGAAFGPDPRFIWHALQVAGGNLNEIKFQLAELDRVTGMSTVRTDALTGAFRPVLSPDGRWLVYGTRRDAVTALRLRDLETGDEMWLLDTPDRGEQLSYYTRDVLPGSAFTPDSRALVTSFGGKLWRVEVPSGAISPIPFTADIELDLGALAQFEYALDDSMHVVSQIRDLRPSPDGNRLAFTALDRLWLMELPNESPRRVTADSVGEFYPTWSPDGEWIAYTTWRDREGGHLFRVRVPARSGATPAPRAGTPERLTRVPGFYTAPVFSPDGQRIVLVRGPRQARVERLHGEAAGLDLAWLDATGGAPTTVTALAAPTRPHIGPDPTRIYFFDGADGLVSIRWDGSDRRLILTATMPGNLVVGQMLLAPDGRHAVVAPNLPRLWVVALPAGESPPISVSLENQVTGVVPVRSTGALGGEFPSWSAGGDTLHYSLGRVHVGLDIHRLFRSESEQLLVAPADTADRRTGLPAGARHREIRIAIAADRPSGTLALRSARIITMKGDEIIENGDIVVNGNRIAAVGPRGSVLIPSTARVIDVTGKTILPGWIDIHHHSRAARDVHETQPWEYTANLAHGVTSVRDPQPSTTDFFSYADRAATGDLIAPRMFSTGPPPTLASKEIRTATDAKAELQRYSDYYHTETIKWMSPAGRQVRQWAIMAAHELQLTPTAHAQSDFTLSLTLAVDGYAGHEHTFSVVSVYEDVVRLFAASGITYTPTLISTSAGDARFQFYARENAHGLSKLRRFIPHREVDRRTTARPPRGYDPIMYTYADAARQAAKIVAAGGFVGLGGHGGFPGLDVHVEMWMLAAGLAPHEVLRAATINGARAIGHAKDLGSLEPGKLADLQVLDANPLEDIRHTTSIRYLMKNGRLYEADDLTEIWPRYRRRNSSQAWDADKRRGGW